MTRADDNDFGINLQNEFEIIRFTVSDSGPGIDEASLKNVFERFYRTESSRSRDSGGTGLGLSLVASIVKAHNGSAWVASNGIGSGSTFGFDLILDVSNDGE